MRERLEAERSVTTAKVEKALPPVNAQLALRLRQEANRARTEPAVRGKAKSKVALPTTATARAHQGKGVEGQGGWDAAGGRPVHVPLHGQGVHRGPRLRRVRQTLDEASWDTRRMGRYRLLNPALQRIGRSKPAAAALEEEEAEAEEPASTSRAAAAEDEVSASDVEGSDESSDSNDTSDDNDEEYRRQMRSAHRQLKKVIPFPNHHWEGEGGGNVQEAVMAERAAREEARAARLLGSRPDTYALRPVHGGAQQGDVLSQGPSPSPFPAPSAPVMIGDWADMESMELGARVGLESGRDAAAGVVSSRRQGSGMEI